MHLPARFAAIILTFAPVFRQRRTWRHAELLLIGAILAPGKRTVTSLLRVAGLNRERRFTSYHRGLNRAAWDARAAARLPLGLLIVVFVPSGPVVLGIDDTIERRRGKRIRAKGIYRDPVRSSKGHFVKAGGLRRLSLMLLAPIPWAGRVWALPFLTALAPSERYGRKHGRRHRKLTDWARQMALQARPLRGHLCGLDPLRIGIGGSLAAPPLPHHRAYGSVHGGSPDQAAVGAKEGRPSAVNVALDRAMLRPGLAAIRQGPWALAAVCAASRRGTSLLNSCRNRFHPFRHGIQAPRWPPGHRPCRHGSSACCARWRAAVA